MLAHGILRKGKPLVAISIGLRRTRLTRAVWLMALPVVAEFFNQTISKGDSTNA
jgi:hypothetical protein